MLLRAKTSALLLVDLQERLAPAVAGHEAALTRVELLLRAAGLLAVPCLACAQNIEGLGPVLPRITALLPAGSTVEKLTFSAMAEPRFAERFLALGKAQAVVVGMETHVCVLQTAVQLADQGIGTYVVSDACGSRRRDNHDLGLARLARSGVEVVSSEMVVFEWLERAGTGSFRELLGLIK